MASLKHIMSSSILEARIRALELQVQSTSDNKNATAPSSDVTARIEALERNALQQLPSSTQQLWKEIESMQEDLSPGTALTHQKQIMAPILYRRQQILAEKDTFSADMEQVARILNLLLIDQDGSHAARKGVTEQQVVNAPILVETTTTAEEDDERLDRLAQQAVDLRERAARVSHKLDSVLRNYASLVGAVSEKLVLFEEDVRRMEEEKTSQG